MIRHLLLDALAGPRSSTIQPPVRLIACGRRSYRNSGRHWRSSRTPSPSTPTASMGPRSMSSWWTRRGGTLLHGPCTWGHGRRVRCRGLPAFRRLTFTGGRRVAEGRTHPTSAAMASGEDESAWRPNRRMKLSKRGRFHQDYWRQRAALRSLCADVSWHLTILFEGPTPWQQPPPVYSRLSFPFSASWPRLTACVYCTRLGVAPTGQPRRAPSFNQKLRKALAPRVGAFTHRKSAIVTRSLELNMCLNNCGSAGRSLRVGRGPRRQG